MTPGGPTEVCRWLAYHGPEIRIASLLQEPEHSLIEQSYRARESTWVVNGDGVGIGWFDQEDPEPGLYREIRAAWNDDNIRSLARHVRSGRFFAHVRAVTRGAVARVNTHPFRVGRWIFQHNGDIGDYHRCKRLLDTHIDDQWYGCRMGQTDSETMFMIALSQGLQDDPVSGITGMIRIVEDIRAEVGASEPFLMSIAATGGEALWAARWGGDGHAPSLYWGTGLGIRSRTGDLLQLPATATVVVSEPLDTEVHAWHEVPERTILRVDAGGVESIPIDI